jgi:hypothetical protein
MSIIQKHARVLEVASFMCGLFLIAITASKWLLGIIPTDANNYWIGYTVDAPLLTYLPPLGWLQRFLGLGIDGIAVTIACLGIIQFMQLCKELRNGQFFSPHIAAQLHRLSMYALAWTLYAPIRTMALSLITSLHQKPTITLMIGTHDIINIVLLSSFVLLTALIKEASKLKQEHDLTV